LEIKRGDIIYCELDGISSEQQGVRPVVIVSNEFANIYSPVLICCPITTSPKTRKKRLPTHVPFEDKDVTRKTKEIENSIVLCEQIRAISRDRIISPPIGRLADEALKLVEKSMLIAIGC
jgi:mRNA interferase MazF